MAYQTNQNITLPPTFTHEGESVGKLSYLRPVLLVFLRHFGCTFCREALGDLATHREAIDAAGAELVLVHMSDGDTADEYFSRYGLTGVPHVSDPECLLYRAYGLEKGAPRQLFGLQSWIRGFEAGVMHGHGVGMSAIGDGFQMPGVFVAYENRIRASFVHDLASDRPEYVRLLTECCSV